MKKERFTEIYRDGSYWKDEGRRSILVDEETGVHYLVWKSGYGGGITPLLDSEGRVVIRKPADGRSVTDSFEIRVGGGGEITVKGGGTK